MHALYIDKVQLDDVQVNVLLLLCVSNKETFSKCARAHAALNVFFVVVSYRVLFYIARMHAHNNLCMQSGNAKNVIST